MSECRGKKKLLRRASETRKCATCNLVVVCWTGNVYQVSPVCPIDMRHDAH